MSLDGNIVGTATMTTQQQETITVKVLFFASAREAAGVSQIDLTLASSFASSSAQQPNQQQQQQRQANTADLRRILAERYPKLAATVLQPEVTIADNTDNNNNNNLEAVTLALNEEYVPPGAVLPLKSGDTVALIPPISGG